MTALHIPADVHQSGKGTPLVLLHGLGGSWPVWGPVLEELGKHHRLIVPTLPMHIGGMPVKRPYTVAAFADTLLAQLRALGIERAHVAGNSLGGWLSLELARRGFARSVVALSPAGGFVSQAELDKLRGEVERGLKMLPWIYPMLSPLLRFEWARKAFFNKEMLHPERLPVEMWRGVLQQGLQGAFIPELLANTSAQLELLDAGDTPIRIAWSEFDQVIPFAEYGRPLCDRIKGHELTFIKNAGHVPIWDQPEATIRAILEVTQKVDAAAAA